MKLGAIDIGSNAARLLIVDTIHRKKKMPEFNKLNLVRVPLRLGFDVFETGKISQKKINMFLRTMRAFKDLLEVYEVKKLKACATSAMRDARNSSTIIKSIKQKTGMTIEVISGDKEATYLCRSRATESIKKNHSYLYIDVGGGSTELSLFKQGNLYYKKSFNIGTIRLLKDLIHIKDWNKMKTELKKNIKSRLPIDAIGVGGNINKIFSLSKKKNGKALNLQELKNYYKSLKHLSVTDRMRHYELREDRADVIVPALQIYINIMRWIGIDKIYVPQIGLVDGLIHNLYQENIRKNKISKKNK